MKTTNVENNPGPASIILVNGAKDLDIACSMIMGEGDVIKNPLNITDAKIHECYYDEEKNEALRKYDEKVKKADFEIMKETRNTRKKQGRKIEEIPEMPEITELEGKYKISDNGEIIREDAGIEH